MQLIRTPTLRPLRHLTKHLREEDELQHYERLIPSLHLYLSNNRLDHVHGEVFQLENLTVLSLRSNNLKEISASIGKLGSLQELNLGSNQLNWLPWELLQLIQGLLTRWTFFPNPFIRPVPSTWEHNKDRTIPDHKDAYQIASTQVAFLDITGTAKRQWRPAPSTLTEYWPEPAHNDEFFGPPENERTKGPSLLELALRECYKAPQLSQLPFMLPDDVDLTHLIHLLKQTFYLKEAGGRNCSICGKEYIVPRTEWVEWWCIGRPDDNRKRKTALIQSRGPIPFLRRGCSWACWVQDSNALIRGWSLAPSGDRPWIRGGESERGAMGND